MRSAEGVRALVFVAQSETARPKALAAAIDAFVRETLPARVATLGARELGEFSDGIVEGKLVRERRLGQEAARHWDEVVSGRYEWDRPQREARDVRALARCCGCGSSCVDPELLELPGRDLQRCFDDVLERGPRKGA